MKNSLVFFGTGPVALSSLQYLANRFVIEAIITKPVGHIGRKPNHELSVEQWAQRQKMKVFLPINAAELQEIFKKFQPTSDVGVVVDYGIIIPPYVIKIFKMGIVNSHFSLLPEWRGADPITFAILSGQQQTGVSIMLIVPKLDEGPLLAQVPVTIPSDDTTPDLTKQLIAKSNPLIARILPRYLLGEVQPYPQNPTIKPSYSRKILKEDGVIDWNQPAKTIEREIRAYYGWPGSSGYIGGKRIIITRAKAFVGKAPAGKAFTQDNNQLFFGTGHGLLKVYRLKPAGKKEMSAEEFLRGLRPSLPALKV